MTKLSSIKVITLIAGAIVFCPGQGHAAHPADRECAKCHMQHNNDEYKLLSQKAIEQGEISCFSCHSADSVNNAPNVEREFTGSQSHHPLGTYKECLTCHVLNDKHNDGRMDTGADLPLKDPDPQDAHVYQPGGKINDFCLSCHDNSPVTLGDPPRTPVDLSSAYEFTGHGKGDINEPCTACHEPHASLGKPYLIKDMINNAQVSGNDNSVCFACHAEAEGTYAGRAVYESSEHGVRSKLCIDCHDPHGDSKDLCYLCHNEKYSSHYSAKRDKLCVDCHDPHQKADLKMTKGDEERLCFNCHAELENEFGNTKKGISGAYTHHKVDDEEYGGGKVECHDCHNPHAVSKFNIVSDPSGSGFGSPSRSFPSDAYNQRTDMYDDFCLACHDGSRFSAKDIKSELNAASNLETDFTADGTSNLHALHKTKGYGCQNCHDAHSSRGTQGIKRGALLNEGISVEAWEQGRNYYQGKNSCSSSQTGLGCH